MFLDDLVALANVVRRRIDGHRPLLTQNETRTRYALVDPVLEALGWDVRDPSQVIAEYSIGNGRADYALMAAPGKPDLVVEAKALGKPLDEGLTQSINYCLQAGIAFLAVTDGERWEIYEPHRMAPLQEKLVERFALTDADNALAMKLLWLWRGNFGAGEPAGPPSPVRSEVRERPAGTEPTAGDDGWVPLGKYRPGGQSRVPASIRFPDGDTRPLTRWFELQIVTVQWLVNTGRLDAGRCPVTTVRGTHLVHTAPRRNDGEPFRNPREAGGL